jgi:WhiB family redox-sensing transcriptional regulator
MSNRNQQSPERIMALVAPADLPGAPTLIDAVPIDEIPYDDINGWMPYSLCAQSDPEAWFPEKGGSTREAKKICGGCPVRDQCLKWALATDERFGVWGGLSERDRRKLRKKAAQGAPAAGPVDDDCDGEEDDRPTVAAEVVTAA